MANRSIINSSRMISCDMLNHGMKILRCDLRMSLWPPWLTYDKLQSVYCNTHPIGSSHGTLRLKLLTYIECKKEVWRTIIPMSITSSCCEVAIANSRRGWTSGTRNLSAVCATICPLAGSDPLDSWWTGIPLFLPWFLPTARPIVPE
jgi:hypothetical protein